MEEKKTYKMVPVRLMEETKTRKMVIASHMAECQTIKIIIASLMEETQTSKNYECKFHVLAEGHPFLPISLCWKGSR